MAGLSEVAANIDQRPGSAFHSSPTRFDNPLAFLGINCPFYMVHRGLIEQSALCQKDRYKSLYVAPHGRVYLPLVKATAITRSISCAVRAQAFVPAALSCSALSAMRAAQSEGTPISVNVLGMPT